MRTRPGFWWKSGRARVYGRGMGLLGGGEGHGVGSGVGRVEDHVEDMSKAEAAAQQLFFDDGSGPCDIIVGELGAFGIFFVNISSISHCLLGPVVESTGNDSGLLVGGQAVELLLPLGVAPFVSAVYQGIIPNGMQLIVAAEVLDRNAVAAKVGGMSQMQGLMQIAHHMHQYLERQSRIGALSDAGKALDLAAYCSNGIAGGIGRSFFIAHTLIDVLIMPSLGICIRLRMAGVVQPVSPINNGPAVENIVDGGGRCGRQMLFGDIRGHIVAFLPPAKSGGDAENDNRSAKKQFLKIHSNNYNFFVIIVPVCRYAAGVWRRLYPLREWKRSHICARGGIAR